MVYDASGRTILRSWRFGEEEESDANVELAAQAPTLKKRLEALRRALQEISDYPANSNSDPDVMGDALDNSQEIAANALRDDDAEGGGGAA